MAAISKEEFVKCCIRLLITDGSWEKAPETIKKVVSESYEHDYDNMNLGKLNLILLDRESWLAIQDILEDIVSLYKEYGLEDDSKLTKNAQDLKRKVLAVKDDFRLDELVRFLK